MYAIFMSGTMYSTHGGYCLTTSFEVVKHILKKQHIDGVGFL